MTEVPNCEELERKVLGYAIYNNDLFDQLNAKIEPEAFYSPAFRKFYLYLLKKRQEGHLIDELFCHDYFRKHNLENFFDDFAFVKERNYSELISEFSNLYDRRRIIATYTEAISKAYSTNNESISDILSSVEAFHYEISEADKASSLGEVLNFLNNDDSLIETGLHDLDVKLGKYSFEAGDLIVIGGRPSMGKTNLAMNLIINISEYFRKEESDKSVLFASLEMNEKSVLRRFHSISDVPEFDSSQAFYAETKERLNKLKIYIEDFNSFSNRWAKPINMLIKKIRDRHRRNALGLVVVDNIQLLQTNDNKRYDQNRTVEISAIARALKWLAKEINCPVVVLSPLSRHVESRDNKRPILADLRDSGSIEDIADLVMLLYREGYYLERQEPARWRDESEENFNNRYSDWMDQVQYSRGVSEINIAKNRKGYRGVIRVMFDEETGKFKNLEA